MTHPNLDPHAETPNVSYWLELTVRAALSPCPEWLQLRTFERECLESLSPLIEPDTAEFPHSALRV